MDIYNMDFIKLLPAFMREDAANIGLSKAVDEIIEQLAKKAATGSTWDQLNNMGEQELDLLAEELNITWYDKAAEISAKRTIIQESDMVHSKLGTNWAVKQVINAYFGEGRIIEWFDYDGKPYHFKIETPNKSILNKKQDFFQRMLNVVKRESACLECLEIDVTDSMDCYLTVTGHKVKKYDEDVDTRQRNMPVYVGILVRMLRITEGEINL